MTIVYGFTTWHDAPSWHATLEAAVSAARVEAACLHNLCEVQVYKCKVKPGRSTALILALLMSDQDVWAETFERIVVVAYDDIPQEERQSIIAQQCRMLCSSETEPQRQRGAE